MLLCFVWSKKVASSSSGVVCGLISPFTIRDWLLTVSYWCAGEHSCWVCYGVSCPGCSISRLFCPSALPFSLLSSSQYFLTIEGVVQILCLMPNIRFSFIQASWTVPSHHTRNTQAEQRTFSVWDEVCCVEKASGTPYLRTVGVLAAWRQKLTATFSLLTSFLHKVYRKKAELSYRQICQHLYEGSWHFKNTWLWIVLKY